MSIYAAITIGLLLGKIALMLDRRIPSDLIGLGIIAILLLTGALSTTEALSCFSNESVVLVGALSIVVAGLIYSGAVNWFTELLFSKSLTFRQLLRRMLIPVATLSIFIISEAVVAIFTHITRIVGRRIKVEPSRVLLPLSCAAALGSMCSLLGSPANLVIANFYRQTTGEAMAIFEPFLPGLICAVVGIVSISLLRQFLPLRKSPEDSFADSADYTVELLVPTDSPVVGSTVAESGLDNVHGGHLIEIVRFDREVISPVPADEFLLGGDHLVYTGQINAILNLRKTHGLVNATHHVFSIDEMEGKNRHLQVATVNPDSTLVGRKMSETHFEDRNGVVLVAIAREGHRLQEIPREVSLRAGDTLLLEGTKLLPEHFRNTLTFFDSEQLPTHNTTKSILSSLILMALVALSMFNIMPLLHSTILAALLMVVCRCCNIHQAQNAINWKLLMVFAGSVCLGKALDATGVAAMIGQGVSHLCGESSLGALILILTTTTIVTQFLGNTLVAAIFTPISLSTSAMLGANPMTFCVGVLIAANTAFCTPISSNGNVLIYGPGGYRFSDYYRVGLPLSIIVLATNILVVNLFYPL